MRNGVRQSDDVPPQNRREGEVSLRGPGDELVQSGKGSGPYFAPRRWTCGRTGTVSPEWGGRHPVLFVVLRASQFEVTKRCLPVSLRVEGDSNVRGTGLRQDRADDTCSR